MSIEKAHRMKCVNLYKISNGCSICGYNKHPSALCFDHINTEDKHDAVKNGYSKRSSAGGMYRLYSKKYSIDELINEIKKCRLLCMNCHMEYTHNKIPVIQKNNKMGIEDLYLILKDHTWESQSSTSEAVHLTAIDFANNNTL